MQLGRRVPLEGEELRLWQEQQRARLMEAEPMAVTEALPDGPEAASLTEAAVDELQTRSAPTPPGCKCLEFPGTNTADNVQGMSMGEDLVRQMLCSTDGSRSCKLAPVQGAAVAEWLMHCSSAGAAWGLRAAA